MSPQISFWSCFGDSCLSRNVFLSSQLLGLSIRKCWHHSLGSFLSLWLIELSDSSVFISLGLSFLSCYKLLWWDRVLIRDKRQQDRSKNTVMRVCSLGIKKSKFWFLWLLLGSACGTARGMRITEKMEGFCIFWVLERTPYFPLKTQSGACLGVQYPPSGFRLPCLRCLGSRDAVGKKRQVHGQCLGFLLISFNFSVSVNFFLEFFSRCLEHSALF